MKKLLRNLLIGTGAATIVAGGTLAAVLTINSQKKVQQTNVLQKAEVQSQVSSVNQTNQEQIQASNNISQIVNKKPTNSTTNVVTGNSTSVVNPNISLFSVAASYDDKLDDQSQSDNSYELSDSITTSPEEGWKQVLVQDKKTGKIAIEQRYQSCDYYNDRKFMPIITDSDSIYPNERNSNLSAGQYPGWNRSSLVGYTTEGNETTSNKAFIYSKYTLNPELNSYFTDVQKEIKSLWIDCSKFANTTDATTINNYLVTAVTNGVEFVTISNASQKLFENIVIPNGIKKLTVLDSNNNLKSIRGITINETVVELELYTKATGIDPLILNDSTHVVFDHAIIGNYEFASAQFVEIDLSLHTDLTNEQLQEAINIVYGKRIKERSFQGKVTGGYISCLDLTNTPIQTLNNVYIPIQEDGRFTISNLQWSSNIKENGEVIITIQVPKYSNDSKVEDIHDPSGATKKVNKIVVNSNSAVTMKQATDEVVANIKKFPYATLVDLSGIQLSDGTLSELVTKVKEALNIKDTEDEPSKITFTIEKQVVQE